MAASSFAGTNIRVEIDPTTAAGPQWERQGYTTARHIPSSNSDKIQVMGYGHGVLTVRLLVDATEWVTLSGQLLDSGTLIMAGVSQGDCLLESLSGPAKHVDGWVTVSATFRQTVPS